MTQIYDSTASQTFEMNCWKWEGREKNKLALFLQLNKVDFISDCRRRFPMETLEEKWFYLFERRRFARPQLKFYGTSS